MAAEHSTEPPDYTIPYVLDRDRFDDDDYQAAIGAAQVHLKLITKAERDLSQAIDHLRVLSV